MNLIYLTGTVLCIAFLAISLAVFPPLALIVAPVLLVCLQKLGVVPKQ